MRVNIFPFEFTLSLIAAIHCQQNIIDCLFNKYHQFNNLLSLLIIFYFNLTTLNSKFSKFMIRSLSSLRNFVLSLMFSSFEWSVSTRFSFKSVFLIWLWAPIVDDWVIKNWYNKNLQNAWKSVYSTVCFIKAFINFFMLKITKNWFLYDFQFWKSHENLVFASKTGF